MDKERYNKVAKITGILVGIILVLGISYAVFRTTSLGEQNNTISAGKLDVKIENEQNEINMEKAFPVSEEEGLKQTPYTFDVVNKGTIEAEYDLYLEVDESVSTLPTSVIRYYLTVEEDGREKIITTTGRILEKEEKIEKEGKSIYPIDIKYINPEKVNKYKLYLWIDEEATTEQAVNKTFEARVRVEAEQIYKENKLVKVVDISNEGNGSVNASFYANGVIIVRGEGTIQPGLSDTLKFENEALVENYKKVFTFMGYDVSNLNTMEELENYLGPIIEADPDFDSKMEMALQVVCIKEVLEEMGHDSSRVTDIDTAIAYVIELGYCDAEGNPTEQGEAFFARFDEKINNDFSGEKIPPKKIILEDGITNIPNGLFTGNEAITEVVIPASVTSIDDNAFSGCRNLTEINIPSSVKTIGDSAFGYCTSLTTINLSNSITSLGKNAFQNCSNLISVSLPSSITEINDYTFWNCTNLSNIKLPDSLIRIGKNAFASCTNLISISLPYGITEINEYTFWNCTKLSKIDMPDGVTRIGVNAFTWAALTELTLPKSVIAIDRNAFSTCRDLKSVTLPNTLTTIGNQAFRECTSLTEVTIPDSVTSLGSMVFDGCTNFASLSISGTTSISVKSDTFSGMPKLEKLTLTGTGTTIDPDIKIEENKTVANTPWYQIKDQLKELVISENITEIKSFLFYEYTNIKALTIPVTTSAFMAFQKTENIEKLTLTGTGPMLNYDDSSKRPWDPSRNNLKEVIISKGITEISSSAFYNCTSLTSIEISDTVTKIALLAFADNTSLTSIKIPASVASISERTFENSTNLTKIEVDRKNENYMSEAGILYNKNQTELLTYPAGKTEKTFNTPATVTDIGSFAFEHCTSLISIEMPAVTSIGEHAFYECSSITTINMPSMIIIGDSAFYNCTSLTSIEIPDTVTNIGSSAFYNCTGIKSITIPNGVTYVGVCAFNGWISSQTINIDNTASFVKDNWSSSWKTSTSAQVNYLRS